MALFDLLFINLMILRINHTSYAFFMLLKLTLQEISQDHNRLIVRPLIQLGINFLKNKSFRHLSKTVKIVDVCCMAFLIVFRMT